MAASRKFLMLFPLDSYTFLITFKCSPAVQVSEFKQDIIYNNYVKLPMFMQHAVILVHSLSLRVEVA